MEPTSISFGPHEQAKTAMRGMAQTVRIVSPVREKNPYVDSTASDRRRRDNRTTQTLPTSAYLGIVCNAQWAD